MSIRYDNHYIKEPGYEVEYTPHQVQELYNCSRDIMHFLQYIKIVTLDGGRLSFGDIMYDFQEEIISTCHQNRYTIILASRQSGKSTTIGSYALWYACFNQDKFIGIASNKASSAKDILRRIKIMYEELPLWLKPGVIEYNKNSIEFDNGSKIETAATTEDSFRGRSINCVPDSTKVCVCTDNDDIYYTTIKKANSSSFKNKNNIEKFEMNFKESKKFYTIYKITNLIDDMIYIGFHSTNDLDDGYMGSGKYLKRAIEKYGIENFKKQYLAIFDNKEDINTLNSWNWIRGFLYVDKNKQGKE